MKEKKKRDISLSKILKDYKKHREALALIPVLTSLPTAPDKKTKEDSLVNRTADVSSGD